MEITNLGQAKTYLKRPLIGLIILLGIIFFISYKIDNKDKHKSLFSLEIQDYLYKSNNVNPLIKAADIYKYNQDYLKARLEFEKLWNSQGLHPIEKAYVINQLAFTCLMTNQDSMAKIWIDTLDEINKTQNFHEIGIEADNNFNKGILYNHFIKPYQAKPYFEKALAVYRSIYGDRHLKVALCLNQMGLGLLEYERFTDTGTIAFYNIRLANDIFQSNPQLLPYSAENDLAMGAIALLQRDHVLGQAFPNRALKILGNLPYTDTILKARLLCLKGNLVKKTEQLDGAETLFLQAVALAEPTNHPRLQEFYRDLIINHIRKKDKKAFWQTLLKLEGIVKKQGFDYFAFPERLKGFYYYLTKQSRESINYYTSFFKKFEKDTTFNYRLFEESLYNLNESYINIHKPDSALIYWGKLLFYKSSVLHQNPNIEDLFLPKNYRLCYNPSIFTTIIAHTLLAKFDNTKNESNLELALRAYLLTDSLLFPGIKSSDEDIILTFQNQVGDNVYSKALQTAWLLYQKNKTTPQYLDYALQFTERMKAYLLFRDNNQLPDTLRKLLTEINFLKWRNSQGWQDKDLADKTIKTRNQYEATMLKLRQNSNGFLLHNIVQPIPTIAQVQDFLKADEAVVEYSLAGNKLHIIYISKTQTYFHQADTVHLDTLISQYRAMVTVGKGNAQSYGQVSFKLYQILLAPLESLLYKTPKLLIIPDRALHSIPFEALVTKPILNNFEDTTYLLHRFLDIQYSPSWKMYEKNRKNAIFSVYPKRGLCFTYGDTEGGDALRASGKEIEAIENVFGQSVIETNMFSNCTKKRFLEKITHSQPYDLIHLSLHAQSNPKKRQDNKIWFKIKPRQDTLYGFEIQNLALKTPLVVLSGCETALGDAKTGEGVYSLSRSFLQAGASNVVATLWSVSNTTNAKVMQHFYTNLAQHNNMSITSNLCLAKRQYMVNVEDKSLAHPYYWAGLIALH